MSRFNAAKTHCPKGHAYDEENTIWRRGKWRVCRMCRQQASAASSPIPGYKDKVCPICGVGYFANVARHAVAAHGQKLRGHAKLSVPMSLAEIDERFGVDRAKVRRRQRQWAALVEEEQAKGGYYISRLARRWRVPVSRASKRVRYLRGTGLLGPAPKPGEWRRTTDVCIRGHRFTPENTKVNVRGDRVCLACAAQRARQYRKRQAS